MKSILFATTFFMAAVSVMQAFKVPQIHDPPGSIPAMQTFEIPHPYIPPGLTDLRSPCPAINVLANHGYLPRNGSQWKAVDVIPALVDVYNIEPSLSSMLAWGAVYLVGNPLTRTFSLGDFSGWEEIVQGVGLSRHNRIEHDASLTRLDKYFGDNQKFNPELYQHLKDIAEKLNGGDFNTEVMSVHRYNRYQDSKANNPSFTFGAPQQLFAYAEAAIALLGLGGQNGTAAAVTLDSFFIHERIPDNYIKNPIPITGTTVMTISQEIFNKNPVPVEGIDFEKVQDFECHFIKIVRTLLPDIAPSLIDFIAKNTGISLSTNC
ncbi:Chloroperoxidase [Endogone sp. FLAS-F59071]|nr:Chloroperoxidase [Endogone sp. FLAS-F59071]|eukprot:RUS21392.1 Chloroperoxidase [Endogone sp. FLAS-F59071]